MTDLITESLIEQGVFVLTGAIDEDSGRDVVEWILEHNLRAVREKQLRLFITSPGGTLADTFAIVEAMRTSAIPVHTYGLGQICSGGVMVFVAGDHRVLTPNTEIMCHQLYDSFSGKHHEWVSRADAVEMAAERIVRHYQRYTGLTAEDVEEKLLAAADKYLTAEQALILGLCDEVSGP